MASRRESRTEAKRREIIDAAAQVYARESFDAATMAKVAAEAGVAVGTFYLYFKDKEELRLAVVESKAERVLAGAGGAECQPASSEVERLSISGALVEAELETLFLHEPRRRREREARARRREILEAAARVVAREGFLPATMAQVAAEAGVAVGTLYLYFKRKEDLYYRLVEAEIEELLSHLRAEAQRAPRALGKLHRIVVAELQFFTRNREFFAVRFFTQNGLVSVPKDKLGDGVDRQYSAYLEMITAIIKQGIDEGDLRAAPPADLAHVFAGMLNSMIGKCVIDDGQEALTAKADWLVAFFSRAAAADGGGAGRMRSPRVDCVTEEQPCYIYGVVGDGSPGEFTARWLQDERVCIVRHADLAALVSPATPDGCSVTRPNVVAHLSVLQGAMQSCTVLPMRFGVVAPNAKAVRDQFLRAQSAKLRELLTRVARKVELVLKVSWQEQLVFQEIVAENQEIRALRDSILGQPEQETRSARILLGQMVEADLRARRERDACRILAALSPLAYDLENGKTETEMMVLNAAFLVSAERRTEFDKAVTDLRQEFGQRLAFKYLGPLPPYSFVSISLEVDQC